MKKEVTKSVAKGMKAALDVVLRTEANTASCLIMYQPKAPKELMNYRRRSAERRVGKEWRSRWSPYH